MAVLKNCICSLDKLMFSSCRISGSFSNQFLKKFSRSAPEEGVIDQIFPDIEGSPVSLPNHYSVKPRKFKKPGRPVKTVDNTERTGHIIIECKRNEFNHYVNQTYNKFEPITLASKGWQHKQSRGDFFKINIYPVNDKRENVFWADEVTSFEGLGLSNDILKALDKMGVSRPTYIQAQGIPQILTSQNVLLAGETGCGKTLAYLLPVIQDILKWRDMTPDRKLNCPLGLILVPGRELAYQIADVADKLAKELLFDMDVVVGGHMKRLITHPNFRPVDLFIATIGAVGKLTTSGIYNMSHVRHLVLDEADTVLDDSFNSYVVRYLKKFPLGYGRSKTSADQLPPFCQLTMASATMPTSITSILGDIIVPESLVRVETPRLHKVLVHVPQLFLRIGQSQKPTKLLELVKKNMAKDIPTIIFSNRAKVCDWVSMFLNESGVSCVNLNGDMPTDVRAGRFDQFQRGFVDILSCTDVAGRGLNTIRVKHVINYDFPIYMADYIHRCGRVGRVGQTQDCLITNFVSGIEEIALVQKIETAVRTMSVLPSVNANITRVIHHKIMKNQNI